MKRACSPNSITPLDYSIVTTEGLERPDVVNDAQSYILGGVLGAGKFAWLARGATLEVINTINGERQACCRFGWSPQRQRFLSISSVNELHIEDGTKLLVGLKDLSSGGAGVLVIFDPLLSRVIKAIEVPYPVTVVESLRLLFGIAAVGTEQGHCYLVDLRLDDEDEQFDEWRTSPIEVVDPLACDLAQLRNTARTNESHLGIEVGGCCHTFGRFSYVSCDFTELKSLFSGDVFVTAVKYVRQTSTLVVGFNFGCFQMWNMETLSHVYSSQVGQYYSAVTHFMYQEPENDPRYCCYLWVARGPLVLENCPETPATLTLYQLVFASRDILTGYGVIYKELGGVGRRFEHQLTSDVHHLADATSVGSKIVCCYTLEKGSSALDSLRVDESAGAEMEHFRDLTLAVCVWEAPAQDPQSRPTCHLGIFDINCWYHSQMPPSIRDAMFGSKDPTCPFFAFFSLADILDAASPDGIVDVFVNAKSMGSFLSTAGSTLEEHMWPASLKFDTCCLLETGLVHSKFLGVQRQILANISKQGFSCLSDAHEYFNTCYVAGLLPRNFDLSKPQDRTFHYEALLSVALEHGLVTFITLCIQKLGTGNVTHAGCSLKLILDWAWDRVVDIKDQLDQLCVPLFDGGGGTPDEQMLLMLDNQKVQLAHLTTVFQALITKSAPTTYQGLKDLEARYSVVGTLALYLKVVLWLIGQGLLPEQSEGSITGSKRGHCYPAVPLSSACESRRKDLENLCSSHPGSVGLMVDKVINQLGCQGVSQWISKGGSQQYPPSSLHSLCSLYLLEKVFYLLLDLCFLDTELQSNEVATKFAKAFSMSEDLIKLIQGFWLLDHQDFEAAVTTLLDPVIVTELGPWQRSFIIRTLLAQGEPQKALHYMKVTFPTIQEFSDVMLYITALLTNGKVIEAYHFQKCHQNARRCKELLYHFFSSCQQTQNMTRLLQLPLEFTEEDFLANFLQEETFPHSKELLVMYYFQKGRYVEGIRLNELLKKDKLVEQDERAKVRNALADAYLRCLPRVQRKLTFGPEKTLSQQHVTLTEIPRPKPLSTVVHKVDKGNPISRAVILSSAMNKLQELRSAEQLASQKEAEPFICTSVTPRTKSSFSDSNKVGVLYASENKQPMEDTLASNKSENGNYLKQVSSPTFLDKRSRRQFFSGAEALSLLATPPVVKLNPTSARSSLGKPEGVSIATPQSILKITRVLRRPSPQPSPTSSPPTTRRGSSDPLLSKSVETQAIDGVIQNDDLTTPNRRIRFASENASSPSTSPLKHVSTSFPLNKETVDSSQSNVIGMTHDEDIAVDDLSQNFTPLQPSDPQSKTQDEVEIEIEGSEAQGETELQITAAVMEFTGDSDTEETETHDEDYSSYELDDSDAVLESESGSAERGSSAVHYAKVTSVTVKETADSPPLLGSDNDRHSPPKKMTLTPPETHVVPVSPIQEIQGNRTVPSTSSNSSPQPPEALEEQLLFTSHQEETAIYQTPVEASELSYTFSPPALIQTLGTQGESDATLAQTPAKPSLEYIFSPPLTRSMAKRRSFGMNPSDLSDLSGGREVSGQYTPYQSPSNSPISFVSPVTQPSSLPRSSRKKIVRLPMHSMTLRSRKCPGRPTRAAKLPHTNL
ncbi:hypothetical protein pdam_00000467 [Pocillopora damicornis]|uniref:ELYS beta-propeller domain-containing protein n=1 Tax=Pocillopora damicornis TaxID=46731 RepID=A0A3M6UJK0_POCDA|nr:hypothetical protein pdam_00000467 [Pocillopora damicornis]